MAKVFLYLFAVICLWLPNVSLAAFKYDLGLQPEDIRIAGGQIITGKTMNVVARIHNYGAEDIKANISFYLDSQLINEPPALQVLSGTYDDAWAEFKVPAGAFNIRVAVTIIDFIDERLENNESQTGPLYPDKDTDGDSIGDQQDSDDDNDGLPDSEEIAKGINPQNPDTDGDGHNDQDDAFPLDPARFQAEPAVISPVIPPVSKILSPKPESSPMAAPKISETKPAAATEKAAEPLAAAGGDKNKTGSGGQGAAVKLTDEHQKVLGVAAEREMNNVAIIYQRVGWQKYKFQTDIPSELFQDFIYFWDFGDGSQSAESLAAHHYKAPGVYRIKLIVEDPARRIFTDETNLAISWFNPGNYQLWSLIFLLCAILSALLLSLRRKFFFKLKRIVKKLSKTKKLKNKQTKKYERDSQPTQFPE